MARTNYPRSVTLSRENRLMRETLQIAERMYLWCDLPVCDADDVAQAKRLAELSAKIVKQVEKKSRKRKTQLASR